MRIYPLAICWLLSLVAVTARAEPAMWVVKDHDSTIYLIGTVHLLRPDMVWKSEKVMKAVAESTELWIEIADTDDEAAAAALIQKHGVDPANPLSEKLNAKQKEKLA
jgi:uncharacterized protein YbaP (TraB family)